MPTWTKDFLLPPRIRWKLSTVCILGALSRQVDWQGVFVKIGDFIKCTDFLVEFLLKTGAPEKNQKNPENRQKSGLFWASPFYNAPSLYTVEIMRRWGQGRIGILIKICRLFTHLTDQLECDRLQVAFPVLPFWEILFRNPNPPHTRQKLKQKRWWRPFFAFLQLNMPRIMLCKVIVL